MSIRDDVIRHQNATWYQDLGWAVLTGLAYLLIPLWVLILVICHVAGSWRQRRWHQNNGLCAKCHHAHFPGVPPVCDGRATLWQWVKATAAGMRLPQQNKKHPGAPILDDDPEYEARTWKPTHD